MKEEKKQENKYTENRAMLPTYAKRPKISTKRTYFRQNVPISGSNPP